ncbi:putative antigen KI-67 [Scophthalmus maximus]|uniref:Putative antigen KI-67 n=1 Tax=Scophthalmus maximus TaxID=52904 RepID=A0A2U9CNQ4_SCOMX|nr:putative antigen KI-67 [Scophthalmus maximus]
MPLHGKIVVIKRSGGDGTEFPLTATCLFGRKPDCDIRIQLPQVSKEHCRIDLNENKEVVLTNLSSVNQTRVNGEVLQQSERLKHGDVITIIDRSFRFEYPPAPTPKKRSSVGGKTDTLKIRQDQQVVDTVTVETGEKRNSEVFTDGTNNDNIQRALEKTVEVESKEDGSLLQEKTISPFSDLYQMIKRSLDVKTPRKSSASLLQTPTSRFCTPLPASVRKNDGQAAISTEDKSTPKKDETEVFPEADETKAEVEGAGNGTPKSAKRQRKSVQVASENPGPAAEEPDHTIKSEATSPQRRNRATPQRFTVCEASAQRPKSPMRRRSKEDTPAKPAVSKEQEPAVATVNTEPLRRTSPRNAGKAEKAKEMTKKRKSGELAADLPTQKMKKKRVSFGLQLSPELFDKRLPPDSPLRKGAAPRRSLSLYRPKQSLLRRASVIGLLKEFEQDVQSPTKKGTPSPKKSSSPKNASPKTPTPGKKSPKSRSSSPKAASPGKKSPKSPSTPTVQGRFSVSRISTPSPIAEDVVPDQMPLVTVTPKIPLRRKSMKSASRKTPSVAKSAAKIMRRSGFSRASMKVQNSWAEVVKFGQTKVQVAAPAKKTASKKSTVKKAVSKPQTPARNPCCHISTGHADSPITIVVGRAYKQKALQPTGAAPRVVTNTALFRKNMKMDEDLTGISDMFKTPVNERKRRSVACNSATETPMGVLGTSVAEPSVLNTPEGPGEMIVSPLNVASALMGSSYNSEAVQRLLNEDQDCSFVSEIPASEVHSDESSEQQCNAVKTTPVKTPKQKPEQPECLTGVKRIMKTPRQKAEPVEDIRGNLLVTPKQKLEQQECLTGVKKIFQTPQQEAEPGKLPELVEEPPTDPSGRLEPDETEDQTPPACDLDTAKELDFANEEPREDSPSDVIDVLRVDIAKEADVDEVVNNHTEEVPSEHNNDESSDVMETISQTTVDKSIPEEQPKVEAAAESIPEEQPKEEAVVESIPEEQPKVEAAAESIPEEQPKEEAVVESIPEEQPKEEAVVESIPEEQPKVEAVVDGLSEEQQGMIDTTAGEVTEMDTTAVDPVHEKKSVRGRRAKVVESEAAEDEQEETEHSEEPAAPAPVRGRRGKKTETTVPCTVGQTTRTRNARTTERRDDDLAVEESAPQPSKVAVKPKRGRNAKKASDDQADMVQEVATESEMVPEEESKPIPPVDVDHKASDSAAPQETIVSKPKRGRKTKQESDQSQSLPEQQDVPHVSQADVDKDANGVCSDQLEMVPSGNDESKSVDAMESVPHAPVIESLPEADAETCKVTDTDEAIVVKKTVRGRRGKMVESKTTEDKQEAKELSGEPVAPVPVRGRRGKKAEATATPAVRQTTRTRNAKAQGSASDDKPETVPEKSLETEPETEISTKAVSDETPLINISQEENDSASPAEEAVVKPIRGRRTKQAPVEPHQPEPEKNEVSDEPITIVGKPRRGRKTKLDTTEQIEIAEDAVVVVETEQQQQQCQLPVRAKRGRNAKQEEEKQENDGETISTETPEAQEPVKKLRRTRKTEEEQVKPSEEEEEIHTDEMVVPVEAEALLVAEPLEMNEPATLTTKPRRGGRKAKQSTENETAVVSTEVQEAPAVKPKRSRRGKEVAEEVEVTAEVPEEKLDPELEAEEEKSVEPDAPVIKPTRARGVKTSVKNEVPQVVPVKRARRGAAPSLDDTSAESTVLVSSSVPTSVEPAKRGRRPAAKPTTEEPTVIGDQGNPCDDLGSAAAEDIKVSKRSVRWKADKEVFQIPKATPVKAVRGRKSKLVEQDDTNKTEEKDLSEEVVEAQPIKRARRGAKVADETESLSTVDPKKGAEAETQPKTRRGRSAKK